MTNPKALPDKDLEASLKSLRKREKDILTGILEHLREIETRRIHAKRGYSSMFAYCKAELNYSEGEAYRRIDAMRLIREVPEVEEKLKKGAVSLASINAVQSFFRAEKGDQVEVLAIHPCQQVFQQNIEFGHARDFKGLR